MDPPRTTRGHAAPATPEKRRGGHLSTLLSLFQSSSAPTSVTRARRESSAGASDVAPRDTESRHRDEPARQPRPLASFFSSFLSSPMATPPTEPSPSPSPPSFASPEKPPRDGTETSEDELARSVLRPSTRRSLTRRGDSAAGEVLTMETRKKEKSDRPRRSLRNRKDDILASDTVPSPEPRRNRPKADTVRNRLREDIASQSKVKANNFLVANKECFLPLLPANNYVSKLVSKHDAASIVEYEEIKEQPKGVTATMKPYQRLGLSFLVHLYNNGFSGILGDEMGLGKTLQTLSLFQYLEEQDRELGVTSEELRPYLVVCPLSVLNSWVNEAQRWVPELKVLRFHGTLNERARLKRVALGMEDQYGHETLQQKNRLASRKAGRKVRATENTDSDSYKIIVTTYETFQAEQAWFKHSFLWRYAVLDEGHKIKSNVTQVSASLRNLSAEFRLILTGTPLQNNLNEMWALLAWLYPDVFIDNTQALFKESFDLTRGKVNQKTMDDARRLLELIMLRRMKDSAGVNLGLPPKEEILLYVPLTPMQRFWYTRLLTRVGDGILDDLFSNVQSKEAEALKKEKDDDTLWREMEKLEVPTTDKSHGWEETAAIMKQALEKEQTDASTRTAWQKLMNLVMQLRKCCSHPYLLPGALPDPYYVGEHIIQASGKFILLEKLLRHTLFEQKKKVLIFSGFTRTLDYVEDLLTLIGEHGRKFKHLRLDGSTVRARRNLDIRMFNNQDSEYKVMLLSTRAGGLGINLTSAEDVIFLDEDWNPQITLQAEARAHRIGQTKKVTIYKLCTQGTVEEQMMGRIRKKLYLSAKITESMRSIHSETSTKTKGRPSITDDMPQMDTTQLKTLVRRGAQTLSHPDIDATEMLSWDLETMLQKCRDKPSDPLLEGDGPADLDEEKWLSMMEKVECAVLDGKRYHRELDTTAGTSAANILPSSISREDRRKGKNTTVMMNGFAINKESLNCADWEAVPTFAGKDPRLADLKRDKRRVIVHEDHCLICFEAGDELITCKSCPRSYHVECLPPEFQAKVRSWNGFFCPQHECFDCLKKTSDAGGLIYRCRWCEKGYCEDCLEWGKEDLIGDIIPEYEMLGEPPTVQAFYIKCPSCKEAAADDEERKHWLAEMEQAYSEQHAGWLKLEVNTDPEIKNEKTSVKRDEESLHVSPPFIGVSGLTNGRFVPQDDSDIESVPALTDTSYATPAPGGSGLSTPTLFNPPNPLLFTNAKELKRKRSYRESPSSISSTKNAKMRRSSAKIGK
ncbi:ISWI chromatin-remodeling complex ATPase-like protein ISW2 [Lophiotrema nucula]|uniref:ISWI chromatin-remodeling complex ATPase-like protein ISW2 n=1 Tax=Lophiotrema nucula TaxID=690887 RepID=A0A6A5ZPI8_9PLEO|nr:ISWI chromatin-remodeling complex ATPase-like protein ISW2 [Lophiotrema nucula]